MIRGVFRHGAIQLLQPPPAWPEGQEVGIDAIGTSASQNSDDDLTPEQIDAVFEDLNTLCSQNDPANDEVRFAAIQSLHAEQKARMRQRMGLSS
jgi:hypothetical protein